ncbi:hypothetical protein [Streptomyces sp. NPDC086182]|uniref:hypothetical protein n=1 Tax=Streptomyces sp. NPDC086182 TaxID=3155058 RepID=UPI003448F6D3
MTDTTNPQADELLRRAEAYLSALHGSVARHDNLAANLACAGCELRDQIRAAASEPDDTDLAEPDIDQMMAAGVPVQIVTAPPATFAAVPVPASAPTDRYRTAWLSARHRAGVLSAELTRRAPLLAEYAAAATEAQKQAKNAERIRENADFHLGQEMARRQLAEKDADRLRAELRRLADEERDEQQAQAHLDALADLLPPPADRAALLAEAIRRVEDPKERASTSVGSGLGWESARDVLRRMADAVPVSGPGGAADETRQPEPQAPVHLGDKANAEDCPACSGTRLPYPFTCPGPDAAVAQPDGEA